MYWFDADMNLESVFFPVKVPLIEQQGKIVYKCVVQLVDFVDILYDDEH